MPWLELMAWCRSTANVLSIDGMHGKVVFIHFKVAQATQKVCSGQSRMGPNKVVSKQTAIKIQKQLLIPM